MSRWKDLLVAFERHPEITRYYSTNGSRYNALSYWDNLQQQRIVEIPTCYVERSKENSKVIFLDLVKGFIGMINIGILYRIGKYN